MPSMPALGRPPWRVGESVSASSCGRRLGNSDAIAGQTKRGGRPHIDLAVKEELAAVQLDQRLGDWQAETRTLVAARQMVFHLLKGFEHLLQLLARYADPGILDRNYEISFAIP